MDYKKTAEEIFSGLGGKNNINDLSHCMTRIRVKLNDTSIADKEKISSAEGVITVVEKMGQFQVVIGNKVTKVYDEFIKLVPEKDISSSTIETKEKHNTGNKILSCNCWNIHSYHTCNSWFRYDKRNIISFSNVLYE